MGRCRRRRRRSGRRDLEMQVDTVARELLFQLFLENWTSHPRFLDIDTANTHRISTVSAEHSGLAYRAII